jgi:UDP-glucose 4-epimerase
VLNLGSGKGYSVKEIVSACKELIYSDLELEVMPRRVGDPSLILADVKKSRQLFGVDPDDELDKIIWSGWKSWREKKVNVK